MAIEIKIEFLGRNPDLGKHGSDTEWARGYYTKNLRGNFPRMHIGETYNFTDRHYPIERKILDVITSPTGFSQTYLIAGYAAEHRREEYHQEMVDAGFDYIE